MMDFERLVDNIAQANGIDDSAVFSFGGDTYAFLFLGYLPQEESALMVDNYYPAYQRVRRARLALEAALPASYCQKEVAHGYKGLAVLSGKAKSLRNSLTAIEGWGSQFVMEAIAVEGVWASAAILPAEMEKRFQDALTDKNNPLYGEAWYRLCLCNMHAACLTCDRCVRACPQGAIGEHFDRDKCLRQMQSSGYVEDEKAAKRMGQRVLGCHTCQKVCPLNSKAAVPAEIDGAALLLAAIEGKKALEPFAEYLGNNYLRPAKLVALSLNALANAKDGRWRAQALRAREKYADERVQRAVDRYLCATPDIEREVKYMLSKEDYDRLLALSREYDAREVRQVNYYFDAGEYARARIREKAGKFELTLKRRVSSDTMQEHNADVTPEQAAVCIEKGLSPDFVRDKLGLALPAAAPYEGKLETLRTVWRQDGLTFELDLSRYANLTDYEIECEVTTDAEWRQAEALIKALAPSAAKGKGKQTRYEEASKKK